MTDAQPRPWEDRIRKGTSASAVVVASFLTLLSVPSTAAFSSVQSEADVLAATHPLRAVGSGEDADLEPLIKLVGDAPIVQLGELSHGFGDSFEERIRITKFLHRRLGFDVVLFETPMALSDRMNRDLAGDGPIADAIDQALFPIWAHSEQMLELFRYIRRSKRTGRPIDVLGVDAQFLNVDGEAEALASSLTEVVSRGSLPDPVVADLLRRFEGLLRDLRIDSGVSFDGDRFRDASVLLTDLAFLLDAPDRGLRSRSSARERAWWSRVLGTLRSMVEDRAIRALAPPFQGDFEAYARHPAVHAGQNRRDQAMARNIAWIRNEYYPDRRIIVWLANSHAQERSGELVEADGDFPPVRQHTTGSYLVGFVGEDEVFTLLHSAYAGSYAGDFSSRDGDLVWAEHELEPAAEGTLENLLHELGIDRGIVDLAVLRGTGLAVRQTLGDGPHSPSAYGDALLFLDHDGPSRPRTAPERAEDSR